MHTDEHPALHGIRFVVHNSDPQVLYHVTASRNGAMTADNTSWDVLSQA